MAEIRGTRDETLPAPISHSQISIGSSLPRLSLASRSLPPLVPALSDSSSSGSVRRSGPLSLCRICEEEQKGEWRQQRTVEEGGGEGEAAAARGVRS